MVSWPFPATLNRNDGITFMKFGHILLVVALSGLTLPATAQELRGHGGPVRAVAISADGSRAMTGSFDQSAILWQLATGSAEAVLRFHQGAVNAVAALPDGRFATGGEDGRIAIWKGPGPAPVRIFDAHKGPVSALAVSADGSRLASASWDETVRITPLEGGEPVSLTGHKGPVNGIAFGADGTVVSSGYDATLRLWPKDGPAPLIIRLPSPLNGVVTSPDGEIAVAGADGHLHLLKADGTITGTIEIGPTPVIALAISGDGTTLAAGGLRGQVALIDRVTRRIRATLVGPGLPVWSLAFLPDGKEILSGGNDRLVRRWNALTGEHIGAVVPQRGADVLAGLNAERGAEVFRACAACHTVTPDGGNRAGPTLHGVIGRRIARAPGFNYSPALTGMEIVWSRETIAKLFELGPNAYTPGTKMPEQTIASPEDRAALVEWLEKVTR